MTTGLVPNYGASDQRGKDLFAKSGHYASQRMQQNAEEEDSAEVSVEVHKAQDLHTILSKLLESYRALQETGMTWDYKYRGKVYKGVELVFFLSFVKCDGDEGDKLCGKYTSRGKYVGCLCRYCDCPPADADDPDARVRMKTKAMIEKLVRRDDRDKLRKLSQQPIQNAFYVLRMGSHNKYHIHSACPLDMLHHIELGIFKYCRDCFFAQIGLTSEAGRAVNALSKLLGAMFVRQSDRNMPPTSFAKGINEGKIMGKEFTGVLLVMAAIFQTKMGREAIMNVRGKAFKDETKLDDWAMMVELLLQWEEYLKSDRMDRDVVVRLRTKHRFIMRLFKFVVARTKGMGMKIGKFHAILHLVDDILAFGVPNNVNTGADESHHKLTKKMAKLTQRIISEFEKQTATRLIEYLLLELAAAEVDGKYVWAYFGLDQERGRVNKIEAAEDTNTNITTGAALDVYYDPELERIQWKYVNNTRKDRWVEHVQQKLHAIKAACLDHTGIDNIQIRTEHHRGKTIFRAHPNYRNKGPWNDWAILDWGPQYGKRPAEIFCFLDNTNVPAAYSVELPGGQRLKKGTYALVETAYYVDDDDWKSELFRPMTKDTHVVNGKEEPVLYLADVDAIVATCCVIPDVGNDDIFRYFEVLPKKEWSKTFIQWVRAPHDDDRAVFSSSSEEEEESDEDEEEEDSQETEIVNSEEEVSSDEMEE